MANTNFFHRLTRTLLLGVLLLSLFPAGAVPAAASPSPRNLAFNAGDLDPTFGTDGEVFTQVLSGEDHFGPKMILQPDDKIIVAGECGDDEVFCVIRYNPDGSLDTTFGAPNGYVTTDFTSDTEHARDLALQPDGKIVVIGDCYDSGGFQEICIVRYNSDGSLDTAGFGAPDGYVVFVYGLDDEGESLAIQPDGKIVVAGECNFDNYICVSRRNADGSEDTAFNGGSGLNFINPTSGADDEDPEVALQSDGKIVIAASCDDRDDVCVARFNADGTADDATFGGGGNNWTRTPIGGGFNYVHEIRITGSGRILVSAECDDITYICVVAYDSSGQLDTSFGGGDGIVLTEVQDDWNSGEGMILQDDGKILVVGTCVQNATVCLVRYMQDGKLDKTFGDEGAILHKFAPGYNFGKDVVVQSDGKIVISADCPYQGEEFFCLARFFGKDELPSTYLKTGISGGLLHSGRIYIDIPAGAVPSNHHADIDECRVVVSELGEAADFGLLFEDKLYDIKVICGNEHITQFEDPITICLRPEDGDTFGKYLYHRHASEANFSVLPLVESRIGHVCGQTTRLSLFAIGQANLPLTGFAPGLLHSLPAQPAAKAYTATNLRLSIPSLDVNLDIVGVPQTENGWDVTWLGDQAGYLYGTAFPTWPGNTAITAHVWGADNQPGPFYKLNTLTPGDRIEIEVFGQTYVYEVQSSVRVSEGNFQVLQHSEEDILTLITCESFNEVSGEYAYRRAVQAVLVDVH